ncbi:TIM barrel protein [Microbacterium sp. ARD32]|uniref:sugar phosphate isomerase/epimerase family protein n=1 Tax=Microbacterium sp. ARD32 TaxID=2962577 RepID=UPI002882ACAD|nr:TIM barrel protein [Microbacterium sp. ARD32]MDT0157661.1 TIM barrel protein [Microbacterium sp. ARD32]
MSGIRAFSTLGAPSASIDDLARISTTTGVGVVELRCAADELLTPQSSVADAEVLGRDLRSAGVSPLVVASYVRIARDDGDPVAEVVEHVRLAEAVGASFVRVFGGVEGVAESREVAAARLADAARRVTGTEVTIVMETHDVFLTGAAIADILARADAPGTGALWDVVNPWRAGESPRATADALAPWLRHVQLKDAASPTELAPVLLGEGAVPLSDVLAELDRIGYSGAIALEWERVWYPEVAPVQDALVPFGALLDSAGR